MSDKTALGDRMKRYEEPTQMVLPRRTYTIIRVDGRAFHSYLRKAAKPFDEGFIADMQQVAIGLAYEMSGARLAYVQSDEISILLTDFESHGTEPWFGGKVQKMTSVAAAKATGLLMQERGINGCPHFDARVFTLSDPIEVANYFIWRQRDAVRNSISMAAQANFSHSALQRKSVDEMQEMLFQEHGINWADYPLACKQGSAIIKMAGTKTFSYIDRRGGVLREATAERTWWEAISAPKFDSAPDGFLASQIPALPRLEADDAAA